MDLVGRTAEVAEAAGRELAVRDGRVDCFEGRVVCGSPARARHGRELEAVKTDYQGHAPKRSHETPSVRHLAEMNVSEIELASVKSEQVKAIQGGQAQCLMTILFGIEYVQ